MCVTSDPVRFVASPSSRSWSSSPGQRTDEVTEEAFHEFLKMIQSSLFLMKIHSSHIPASQSSLNPGGFIKPQKVSVWKGRKQ